MDNQATTNTPAEDSIHLFSLAQAAEDGRGQFTASYYSEEAMTMEITIQVPTPLGQQLQRLKERLPEILERGLRSLPVKGVAKFQDEDAIMALLTSQPTPDQVLAITPSPELQARVSDLLARGKAGELSRQEEGEMERYQTLEHLVRLAKAHAYKRLAH